MVRIHLQICEQQGLATGLVTGATGLQCHEDGINLVQHLGVVELQDPALLAQGISIKDAQIKGLLPL